MGGPRNESQCPVAPSNFTPPRNKRDRNNEGESVVTSSEKKKKRTHTEKWVDDVKKILGNIELTLGTWQ